MTDWENNRDEYSPSSSFIEQTSDVELGQNYFTHIHTLWVITSRWSWPGGVDGHPISQTGALIQLSCPSHLFKLAPRTGFHTAHSDRKAPPENNISISFWATCVSASRRLHLFLFYSFKIHSTHVIAILGNRQSEMEKEKTIKSEWENEGLMGKMVL